MARLKRRREGEKEEMNEECIRSLLLLDSVYDSNTKHEG